MKKIATAFIAGSLLAVALSGGAAYADGLKMTVKGKLVDYHNGTPYTLNGYSLMPLRDLLVALGVQDGDIAYVNGTVTAKLGDVTIQLSVDDNVLYKNGKAFATLEVPAKMKDDHVYLPARAVAEALGNQVGYDSATNTVVITENPNAGKQESNKPAPAEPNQGNPSQSEPAPADPFTIESPYGMSVTLPKTDVAANQVYGLIVALNHDTGVVTLKLADGSTKDIHVLASGTVSGLGQDWSESAKDFLDYGHPGMAVLATLDGEGATSSSLKLSSVTFDATVVKVSTEQQQATAMDGSPINVPMYKVSLKLASGKTITLKSGMELDAAIQAGASVTVFGAAEDGKGFESIKLEE